MTGAYGTPGGIASLNKNILASLWGLAQAEARELFVLSLLEGDEARPACLPPAVSFQGFAGNKGAFARSLVRAAMKGGLIIFDHVTLALPALPFIRGGWVRSVIFAHGSEAWRRIRRSSRWSFRAAALCLTNSEYTLRQMRRRCQGFKGRACPLGLSPEFPLSPQVPGPLGESLCFEAADGQRRELGERVLLLAGRMHPEEREKGHYPLLRALPGLLGRYGDLQLVFAGPGDDRPNLARLAQELGVAPAVFLPGYLPVADLQKLYRQCYAYVMPSKQEGFGLAYLEAMNYGKPCVGCFEDGAEEVIRHQETGLLVRQPNDTAELSAVLEALLDDPGRAQQMGQAGFARLHDNFTAAHVQSRIRQHISSIL